jgi:hypothetical protein
VSKDDAGSSLRQAWKIGFLDNTPLDRVFSDFVGASDRKDFYNFQLQADSRVTLNLNGLNANANLFLADATGNLILSSTNTGNKQESIATNLTSGTYYVLVSAAKNASTDYNLNLSARFIVDEEIVSNPNVSLPNPEFDPIGSRITWQDQNNNLGTNNFDSKNIQPNKEDMNKVQLNIDAQLIELGDGEISAFSPTPSERSDNKTESGSTFSASSIDDVITGNLTDIVSDNAGIISLRHQEHSWITADGAIHLMINEKKQSSLFSSFDGGISWQKQLSISTQGGSDGILKDNSLFLSYPSLGKGIKLAQFNYDSTARNWLLVETKNVYRNQDFAASVPSLTIDNQQNIWVTFINKDKINNLESIELLYSNDGGISWQEPIINLPATLPLEGRTLTRQSAKLLSFSGGVGLVYIYQDTINWAYRMDAWSLDTPWQEQQIFQYTTPLPNDGRGHFSVIVDSLDNIHFATADNTGLVYLKFNSQEQIWETPKWLTNSRNPYLQLSISDEDRLLLTYNVKQNGSSFLEVLESLNLGQSFQLSNQLIYESLTAPGNPRMETPGLIQETLPVFQQVSLQDGQQGLVYFDVDVEPIPLPSAGASNKLQVDLESGLNLSLSAPDGAGNNLSQARELGVVDINPLIQSFSDFVGIDDRKDFYRFELQTASQVTLSLNGLTANANLFLQDGSGIQIASSSNKGIRSESIVQNLNPGTYYVLVSSVGQANTDYQLRLSAKFIVDDDVVSDPDEPLPDPEFDLVGYQISWRDLDKNLWVAPVDSQTGDLLLEEKVFVDSGLGGGDGPSWVYTRDGAQIIYTKSIDGELYVARAWWTGSSWQTEILPDTQGGHSAVGTLNPADENPIIRYFIASPSNPRQSIVWRELDNPSRKGVLPETSNGQGAYSRWVEGERSLTYTVPVEGIRQVFKYDVDTNTVTQITFSSTNKGSVFMWQAPEFNNELVFFVVENDGSEATQIGVYRNIGGSWTKFKTIVPPPSTEQKISSPEFFVYNDKSYVSFATKDTQGEPKTVWIAGIDPEEEFYRQVSDPNIDTFRHDPESLVTETGVLIYYTEKIDDQQIIHRTDTGLGLDRAILAINDRASNTLNQARELGWLDINPFPQAFSDFVGIDDRKDFYRFELQSRSRVILKLDGLTANANLFLTDAAGNQIASSTNRGNTAELITNNLNPGTYYVLVRSNNQANTDYSLTVSAQFIVAQDIVSDSNVSLPDPEYDPIGYKVTWQDIDGNLWVAPIDPQTGDFILEQAAIIDTGLATTNAQTGGTGNGPEWAYSNDGSRIVYTKLINGNWYLGSAKWNGSDWNAGLLRNELGEPIVGRSPIGSVNPDDNTPLIKYVNAANPSQSGSLAWLEVDNPSTGDIIPDVSPSARWVEGERSLLLRKKIEGSNQVFKYDIDTETLTQLTFGDFSIQGAAMMWHAPEFHDELVFFTLEIVSIDGQPVPAKPNQIGIYRNLDGEWTKIKTIQSPVAELPLIHSVEYFTYNGKSYLSLLFVKQGQNGNKVLDGSQVWIAGIEPDVEFYRKVSNEPEVGYFNDPESLVTETGAFIYYAQITPDETRLIYRADTGLGSSNSISTLTQQIDRSPENLAVIQFTPNDVVVSDPNVSLPDPEFDRVSNRITWQDFDNNLYVASVDPDTGDLLLNNGTGQLLDTNLVPIFSLANGTGTGNGPEWVYTQKGAEILYSKISSPGQWDLGRARLTETGWQTGLVNGGENGFSPLGSLDPNDATPRTFYLLRTPENPDGIDPKIGAWIDLKDPSIQGILPFEPGSGGRWVEGENSFVLTVQDQNGIEQVVKYDTDTETYEFLTSDATRKDDPFMWRAPELNNELVFFAIENSGSGPTQIGVYREIGGTWTKFKTIDPPSDKQFIDSPEFFVYNDKSYVFFLTQPKQNKKGLSELWLAGIDPEVEFYRELNDPNVDMVRSDPESFLTKSGAYIYYSEIAQNASKTRIIHRTDTGLGLPEYNEILGTSGTDNLVGTAGKDRIIGYQGRDTLTSGGNSDLFVYQSFTEGRDVISDFALGEDKIVLTNLLDSLGYSGDTPKADGYLRIVQRTGGAVIQIDPDGNSSSQSWSALIQIKGVDAVMLDNSINFVF